MGWAGGSDLFDYVIMQGKKFIPEKINRKKFLKAMIEAFESHDWDTLDECLGLDDAYDEVYNELYPED